MAVSVSKKYFLSGNNRLRLKLKIKVKVKIKTNQWEKFMRRQKRKTLKQKKADKPMKPKGSSKYALKKALQKKGKYSPESPITLSL